MDIDDLRVYQLSMRLAEKVWEIVVEWDSFAKYSIGRQYTEAADSIGSNIVTIWESNWTITSTALENFQAIWIKYHMYNLNHRMTTLNLNILISTFRTTTEWPLKRSNPLR